MGRPVTLLGRRQRNGESPQRIFRRSHVGSFCMKHVRREPRLAFLPLLEFGLWRGWARELIFLDLRDTRGNIKGVAARLFQRLLVLFITVRFRVSSLGFGLGIEVLETSGGFETDAHGLCWFPPTCRHGWCVIFHHLLGRRLFSKIFHTA